MRISDFSRYVLTVYATVPMLTVCGGGAGSSAMPAYEPGANRFRGWQGWKSKAGNGLVVFSWQ